MALIRPEVASEIEKYGGVDFSACYNCGNCTAVCPLSEGDATFPRRMIRYAQVGMRDELLASKELWTCYACGECSETCPRQAEPSEFMAASRRYATAAYDRTRIARFLYLQPLWGTIAAVALAVLFGLFMFVNRSGPLPSEDAGMAFFEWIPATLIHDVGLVAMILVFLAGHLACQLQQQAVAHRHGGHDDLLGIGSVQKRLVNQKRRHQRFRFGKAFHFTRTAAKSLPYQRSPGVGGTTAVIAARLRLSISTVETMPSSSGQPAAMAASAEPFRSPCSAP